MEHIFIGRQPIIDGAGQLYGYELLHRRARGDEAAVIGNGDQISSDMLLNAVLEIGIQQISGAHRAFINVTQNLLMNPGLDALPSARIVLEVLEDVPVDQLLLDRLAHLRARKFEIALDDYVCLPERDALIAHADIVKLDVLALGAAALEHSVDALRKRGVRLLAEKVETPEMYARLKGLGFELFQGYFFAKPEIYQSQRILPNRLVMLELLAKVNLPNISAEELANVIRGDVSLSVTVLRWANSSMHGLKFPVESIQRAIVVLGLQTIRKWVALLALARMGSKPSELLTMLLVRARCCELLASTAELPNPSNFFTVGLLSALDVILQMNMSDALERVPLGPEQKAGVMSHAGEFGAALKAVIAMEHGEVDAESFHGLPLATISDCYLSSIAWADNLANTGMLAG
jgi:EAL and modified HD-GYP domain-containing signal transduction protein